MMSNNRQQNIVHAINNYTSRLLSLYVVHHKQKIVDMLQWENQDFVDYIQSSTIYKNNIANDFLVEHAESIQQFQKEFDELAIGLSQYHNVGEEYLAKINQDIVTLAKKWTQPLVWEHLSVSKEDAI